ncbi:hypothetical protein BD626DRAFT_513546 [Schizophyllum amplum]|uniref:Uncharacterized protein n=1 Tax=Schizophyllum amplum TaxID=97359 RepID=A0A550BZ27_9AGAR|nr:hypothetical protein BD626DRAFT_513546 [Auriculariopsis ampla]
MSILSLNSDFRPGDICLTLASRGDGTFHWTITIPYSDSAGVKLHASNKQGPWRFLADDYSLKKTLELCIVMKIGHLHSHTTEDLIRLVEALPMTVVDPFVGEEPRFTCKVWVKQAVTLLRENDILQVDARDIEKAALAWGAKHDPATVTGAPYKFYVYAD